MALCTQTPSETPLLSGSWTRLLGSAPEKDGGPRCMLGLDQMQGITRADRVYVKGDIYLEDSVTRDEWRQKGMKITWCPCSCSSLTQHYRALVQPLAKKSITNYACGWGDESDRNDLRAQVRCSRMECIDDRTGAATTPITVDDA
jgi:hypothetical protein